eukprot:2517152-Pleurochrysis_carterae.AAC.4
MRARLDQYAEEAAEEADLLNQLEEAEHASQHRAAYRERLQNNIARRDAEAVRNPEARHFSTPVAPQPLELSGAGSSGYKPCASTGAANARVGEGVGAPRSRYGFGTNVRPKPAARRTDSRIRV